MLLTLDRVAPLAMTTIVEIIWFDYMQEEIYPQAYRVKDFCRCYAISRASLYREVSSHRLAIVKRGRTTLVTREEAERWFDVICKGTN